MTEPFEPFQRWMAEYRERHGKLPTFDAQAMFREGYMRALREARVRWRGDGKHLYRQDTA